MPDIFEIGEATDEGRVGKNNEDAYSVFRAWLQSENASTPVLGVQVAVVADGIGGSVAGERASRLAVKTIQQVMAESPTIPISQRLETAIKQANTEIYEAAARESGLKGMGTTVVAAAIVDEYLFVAHAGDSRAYLIRGGIAGLLTKDHTWAQEAIEADYLTPEKAAYHPNRNVIKRYLGIYSQVEVDHQIMDFVPPGKSYTVKKTLVDRLHLRPGDTVLLCSDGLTDVVNDQAIQTIVTTNPPQKAADKLIDRANRAGGPDNITTVLVHWPPRRRRSNREIVHSFLLIVASILLLISVIGNIPVTSPALLDESSPITLIATSPSRLTPMYPGGPTPVPPVIPPAIATPEAKTSVLPVSSSTRQVAGDKPLPTSTLFVPTGTPSLPPTLSSTPTRVLAVQTVLVTVTLWVEPSQPISIVLISPPDGAGSGGMQAFKWEIKTGSLKEGHAFELIFWKEGEDPIYAGFGITEPTTHTEVLVNLNTFYETHKSLLQPGNYKWGVRLVQRNPYTPLQYLGGGNEFRFGN